MSEQLTSGNQSVEYASFNRRLIASTLDSILLIILITIAMYPFNMLVFGGNSPVEVVGKIAEQIGVNLNEIESNTHDQAKLQEALVKSHFYTKVVLCQVISLLFFCFFIVYSWVKFRNTPGKWLAEIKILDEKNLAEPSRKQYYLRFLGYFVSTLPLCLGFFAVAWDKKKRTWHDRLAGTVVVVQRHPWKSLGEIWSLIISKLNSFKLRS